jgi:CubicO group peptidase (beta-lactamase class C family)
MVLCAVGLAAPSAIAADASGGRQVPGALDAIFEQWNSKATPGCAVAVSRDGNPIAVRAYGMADLELGVAASPDSLYEAGSDSKQFVAASMLMLARDGKLSLDDDVRKYLPELPDYGARITLRDMLHHTSGLRDWGSVSAVEGWPRNSRATNNQDVLAIAARQKELNFAPGTHYLYSNTNYNLAAIIIARVSGQSLADFTRQRIFVPLGMTHSSWRDDHTRLAVGRTGGYDAAGTGFRNNRVIEDAYGNGGLVTTVGDLLKWQAALDNGFFGPEFTSDMQRPGVLRNGTRVAYGLGLMSLDYHGVREVSHPGWTGGYRAWMARYPDQRLAVALLCNTSAADTMTLGRKVADLYLPSYRAHPFAPSGPPPSGTYVDRLTGRPVRFDVGADGQVRAEGVTVIPVGSGRWQLREDIFVFSRQSVLRESPEGEILPYDKAVPITRLDPSPYVGRFCGVDSSACITVSQDGETLRFSGPRWSGHPLEAAYRDVFLGEGMPGSALVLKFGRDPQGDVDSIRLGESQAYNLLFERVG